MTRIILSTLALSLVSSCLAATAIADDSQGSVNAMARHLNAQVAALKSISNPTPCQKAVMTAILDKNVRELFLEKAANKCFVLKDICCLQIPHIPEQELVLFNFDCKPNCICLVDPQFLVIVDKINHKVVGINDPYQGPTKPCISIHAAQHNGKKAVKTFSGTSRKGDLSQALRIAADKARAAGNSTLVRWELVEVTGERGGFVNANDVTATIRVLP